MANSFTMVEESTFEALVKSVEDIKSMQSAPEHSDSKRLEAELQDLQDEITRLRKVAATYYLYTDEGEKKFLEKFNARIYTNDRRDTWFLKVGDNFAFELPKFVAKSWLQHECSISDVYQYWKEHR